MMIKSAENEHIWNAHDILPSTPNYMILQK